MLRSVCAVALLISVDQYATRTAAFAITPFNSFSSSVFARSERLSFPRTSPLGLTMQLSAKKVQKGDKKPKKPASTTTADKSANKQTSKV
jgi:hypothetical protein